MQKIDIKAYAKINLALDVVGTRPDGYHEVRMIMQTINLYDRIELGITAQPGITVKSSLSFLPNDEGNLAYRAAKLFLTETGCESGVHINILKKIPVAAGMAGGSSDAAAVLLGLNELMSAGFSKKQLSELGVRIGADVPFCILGGTALAEGIGEVLTPLRPFRKGHCLIVKPSFSVSTPWAYSNLKPAEELSHPDVDRLLEAVEQGDYEALCQGAGNVLESVVIPANPAIRTIKARMRDLGADLALMSGSGPTVFGLFSEHEAAKKAYYDFKVGKYGKSTYLVDFV